MTKVQDGWANHLAPPQKKAAVISGQENDRCDFKWCIGGWCEAQDFIYLLGSLVIMCYPAPCKARTLRYADGMNGHRSCAREIGCPVCIMILEYLARNISRPTREASQSWQPKTSPYPRFDLVCWHCWTVLESRWKRAVSFPMVNLIVRSGAVTTVGKACFIPVSRPCSL